MKVYLAYYRDELIDVFDSETKARECCENITSGKLDEGQNFKWENGYGMIIDNSTNTKMIVCEIDEREVK